MPTVFLNERRRRKLPVGSRGMHPGEMCLDFYTLRSPFLGFSVIQSGYWPDFNSESFFLEKFIHLWKLWPIFVKRCRPVWIHACNINVSPSLGSRTWDPVKNNCFSFGFLQKNGASIGRYFLLCQTLLLFPIGCFLDKLLLITRNTLEQLGVF